MGSSATKQLDQKNTGKHVESRTRSSPLVILDAHFDTVRQGKPPLGGFHFTGGVGFTDERTNAPSWRKADYRQPG